MSSNSYQLLLQNIWYFNGKRKQFLTPVTLKLKQTLCFGSSLVFWDNIFNPSELKNRVKVLNVWTNYDYKYSRDIVFILEKEFFTSNNMDDFSTTGGSNEKPFRYISKEKNK